MKKTGYNYPSQNPKVREKSRVTYRKKTGYNNPSQNPEVKEKKMATLGKERVSITRVKIQRSAKKVGL